MQSMSSAGAKSLSMFGFSEPAILWLLPLCLIPLFKKVPASIKFPSITLLPDDRFSRWFDYLLRILGAMLLASLIFGLAGLHKVSYEIPRIANGAHVVLLLDRSRSMDQTFATKKNFSRLQNSIIVHQR